MPNIDEIFKAGLASHEMAPDSSSWNKLSKKLTSKEGKVVLPWYFNPKKALIGAFVISLFSFAIGYVIAQNYISSSKIAQTNHTTAKHKAVAEKKANNAMFKYNNKRFAFNLLNKELKKDNKIALVNKNFDWSKPNPSHKSNSPNSSETDVDGIKIKIASIEVLEESLKELIKTSAINQTFEFAKSSIPTLELKNQLYKANRNTISINRSSFNPYTTSSFNLVEGETIDETFEESYYSSSQSIQFLYGRRLNKNLSFVTGIGIDNRTTAINGIWSRYDKDTTNMNLGPDNKISELNYVRKYQTYFAHIPVGFQFSGKRSHFGYSVEAGAFAQQKIYESRSFSMSDENSLALANDWDSEIYNSNLQYGLYSRIGLNVNLYQSLGMTFNAVIRKRLQPSFSSNGIEEDLISTGLNLGLFYKF